ncbi:MAG: hypothetical protein IID08_10355 [Candidatus Hydrogenedentes bacterium]|nr:hypothetical protein [Candidatus Hydrogenedentota bacterium]
MASHNLVPAKVYFINFAILVFLMTLTVVAFKATFIPQVWALPVAMGIAITKALFIIMIFMNVYWSARLTQVFAAAGFVWLSILLGFLLIEYSAPEAGHIYADVSHIGVHPLDVSDQPPSVETPEPVTVLRIY